jgi:hypothetical protein
MKTHLIYLTVIAIILMMTCNGNSNGKDITFKTKEVKGGFEMVKPKQTEITNNVPNKDNSRVQRNFAHEKNDSINTKLLAENEALIKAFATYTDSVKQAKYLEAISLKDFSQTFNDTSLTVNVFGKVRGEVIGIGLDYTIKPQTVKAQLKQYLLLGGVNMRYNGQFNKSGIDAQLDYISPNKTRYSIGKDLICKDCFTVGIGKKIFEINRAK